MTDCGIHAPGKTETMTSNFLYLVSKKSVDIPLVGMPSASDSAHGRGIKYEPCIPKLLIILSAAQHIALFHQVKHHLNIPICYIVTVGSDLESCFSIFQ